MSAHRHLIGGYLRAALPVGLQVRRCEEPRVPAGEPARQPDPARAFGTVGPWDLWPWCLADMVPEATRAAGAGVPAMVIWHFQSARS